MKAAPVPDEVYPVAHDGEYSVQSSGTGQQVSYVRQNPADSSPKPTTRVVVDYHFVDVQLPAGFAQDGTPLTKPGRTLVRTEHEE